MHELDWLEHSINYYHLDLPIKGFKNCQWLLKVIKEREDTKGDSKTLPTFFKLSYFIKIDFKDPKEISAFDQLVEMTTQQTITSRYILPYFKDIDPNSEILGKIVAEKIQESTDIDNVYQLARIAGVFKRNTKAWNKISLAACIFAKNRSEKERNRIYAMIDYKDIGDVYTRTSGTVAENYFRKRNEAKEGKEKELDRIEYWEKVLEWAENDLKAAEEEAREERGE